MFSKGFHGSFRLFSIALKAFTYLFPENGFPIKVTDSSVGDVLKEWEKEVGLDKVQDWVSDTLEGVFGKGEEEIGDAQ